MPCWPVSHRDGKFQVTDSDGILYPITMGRAPVESLQPGWVPVGLQTGLKPFHLLELRNEGGPIHDAVWYLTEELDYANNTPTRFNEAQSALVVSNISPLLRDIYDQSLCGTVPGVAASTHDFDGINPLFVRELIGYVVDCALTPPDMVSAQRLDSISSHYMAAGVRLSASLLRHSLDHDEPATLQAGFTLASPFDAALLTAQEEFAPGDGVLSQVYRFHDPAGNLPFYLLFPQHNPRGGSASALYLPITNTVFSSADSLTGTQVMTALFSYYATHTERVFMAAEPPGGFASVEPEHPAQAPSDPEPRGAAVSADDEFATVARPGQATPDAVPRTVEAPASEALPAAPPVPEAAPETAPETAPEASPETGPETGPEPGPEVRETSLEGMTEPAVPRPANWWKRLFGLGHP